MTKTYPLDNSLHLWEFYMKEHNFPTYRAKQLYEWLHKGELDVSQMKNLPQGLKDQLMQDFNFSGLKIQNRWHSDRDETEKFLFALPDGQSIETVLMKYHHGYTVCISSQAGCKMGCKFCASSYVGFGRNLTAGEMLGQVLIPSSFLENRVSNVVVMGIGEAFDNYDEFIKFIRLLTHPTGINIGARHITVSTCGLVPAMIKFMEENLQVNLSVSLHSANQEKRQQIMPIAKAYSLNELMQASKVYVEKTKRRVTFEYSLIHNFNDSKQDALDLAHLLKNLNCHVNLIGANEFPGSDFTKSTSQKIKEFREILEAKNIVVTIRREMGSDIMAACGQLRRNIQE